MFQYGGGSAAMTLTPLAASPKTCWKNTSAVPDTGGRHINGQLTDFGPLSKILQAYIICKQKKVNYHKNNVQKISVVYKVGQVHNTIGRNYSF